MHKTRLEAFSDGVLAILITIMVLDLRAPHAAAWTDLQPLVSAILCYGLSFLMLGIYWNNHHHLFQAVQKVNGLILWTNMHLLFWLSLVPFVTTWMAQNHFAARPVALYGGVLWMAALAYYFLVRALLAHHGAGSTLATAIGSDFKGKISLLIYTAAIALAFWSPLGAILLFVAVALIWLVPDLRIEKTLGR
ncbi:MAG: DUF1211 domain-containing protein [Acidobacteriota bacterium]|nr:DUF1211 domain-containing protein [Acidobacteriota bacterium]